MPSQFTKSVYFLRRQVRCRYSVDPKQLGQHLCIVFIALRSFRGQRLKLERISENDDEATSFDRFADVR